MKSIVNIKINKKISIIVPIYNSENTICKTLDSVIDQNYENYEVLLIDDGSTDKSADIIKSYVDKDDRFKYFYKKNSGVSGARNTGIANSTGEFLCFLDSDDFYEYNFLFNMVSEIVKSNSDIVYCGYYISKADSKQKKLSVFTRNNVLLKYILQKIQVHTTGWIIRKKHIETKQILFNEDVNWGEDFEFFCEVLITTSKVSFVNDYLTNYSVGYEGEKLSSFSIDKIDKDFESIMRLITKLDQIKHQKIINALLDYRLNALITYRLINAYKIDFDYISLSSYHKKYKDYINVYTSTNGIRSFKLNYYKVLLYVYLKKNVIKKENK